MSALARSRHRLLRRLLERPDLPERIRELPAPRLAALVDELGLEDSGEVLACTSPEQLGELFDDDVFDERDAIDPERFVLWLEVLTETGERWAADRVAQLPEDLLRGALARLLQVFDLDALALAFAEDPALTEANDRLEALPSEELMGHLLVVRRSDGWDVVWRVLLELSEADASLVQRLLASLAEHSMARMREEGLEGVLDAVDEAAEEAASGREERITALGYVSGSDARAFLALAERGEGDPDRRDAVTAAWFRRLAPLPAGGDPQPLADFGGWLDGPSPLALPSGEGTAPTARMRAALEALAAADPRAHDQRIEELAYLANVCAAVDPRRGRAPFVAGLERALEVCGRGLERAGAVDEDVVRLSGRSLDLIFRDGAREDSLRE